MAVDMYLPAFPAIARDLGVSEDHIQFSLMAFFAGLMLGQLFYGPLSDRFGRKPLVYFGLVAFAVASLGCVFAADARQLTILRFVQGVGGSIGMVISLAIVRDLYTGKKAARLLSLVVLVLGAAPVVAPLLGSMVISVSPWRMVFVILALFGMLLLGLTLLFLPETRSADLRAISRPTDSLRQYGRLLVNGQYIPFVLAVSIAQAGFFAYLSASAPAFITVFGLSPFAFSLVFATNAIGMMAAARMTPYLMDRFRAQKIVRVALLVYLAAALILLVMTLMDQLSVVSFAVILFVVVATLGCVMPLSSVLAMEHVGPVAGTAAALLGAFQFGTGALASGITAALSKGSVLPMVGCIAVCGLVSTLIAFKAFPQDRLQEDRLQSSDPGA
jgi:DHA1 family bicyclomycin/chloramphenicol resistance-like MFS transporter